MKEMDESLLNLYQTTHIEQQKQYHSERVDREGARNASFGMLSESVTTFREVPSEAQRPLKTESSLGTRIETRKKRDKEQIQLFKTWRALDAFAALMAVAGLALTVVSYEHNVELFEVSFVQSPGSFNAYSAMQQERFLAWYN